MAQERLIADVADAIPRFTRGTKIAATAASQARTLPADRPRVGERFRTGRYGAGMRLDEIGEIDGWRCWLCDEPVDPDMSVNDPRGPSIDSRTTERRAKAKGTGKGKGKGTGRSASPTAPATPARVPSNPSYRGPTICSSPTPR